MYFHGLYRSTGEISDSTNPWSLRDMTDVTGLADAALSPNSGSFRSPTTFRHPARPEGTLHPPARTSPVKRREESSTRWFRSTAVWVMGSVYRNLRDDTSPDHLPRELPPTLQFQPNVGLHPPQ